MPGTAFEKVSNAHKLQQDKTKVVSDLFHLGHDLLGLDLLSEDFHRPICSWLTENLGHKRRALYSPRFSYKTSLLQAEITQELINNPNLKIAVISHSLDLSLQTVNGVGGYL